MKFVSKSKVELIDSMGDDLRVANVARVSFNKWKSEFDEKDEKLISYLGAHNHWTPFAHCLLSFRIDAPIFVARQLVKHQIGLVWNEVSRRYVDEEPSFYFPAVWHKRPDKSIKQGSGEELIGEDSIHAMAKLSSVSSHCLDIYKELLANGVAPEEARMILPLNTMTSWIWTGSLVAFARICKLRLESHAQIATQEVAIEINKIISERFPISWKCLLELN